jgi:hypothetical protein
MLLAIITFLDMPPGVTAVDVGSQYAHKLCLMDLVNPFHLFGEVVGHDDCIVVLAVFASDSHLPLESYTSYPERKGVQIPGRRVETPLNTKQGFLS